MAQEYARVIGYELVPCHQLEAVETPELVNSPAPEPDPLAELVREGEVDHPPADEDVDILYPSRRRIVPRYPVKAWQR
jgi:hypothetical protein